MRGFRVGVVNPFSLFGKRVRELLRDLSFPIIELKLFEARTEGGSALTEFDGEIVVTQPLDPDLFPHLDLLFVGGGTSQGIAGKALDAARVGVLTIVASGMAGGDAPAVAPGVSEASLSKLGRLLVAAHPASILIGVPLAALCASLEFRQSCATVMLPASVLGEEAIEELHQQVVKILNFKEPPTDIFREQLAFNLTLPSSAGEVGAVEEAVGKEAAQLAGISGSVSVSLVQVPVFHGYAASLWVSLGGDVGKEDVIEALRRSPSIVLPPFGKSSQRVPSPITTAESKKIHVGWVRRDEAVPGGFWLWVVADSLAVDSAASAIRVAEKILGVESAGNRT